MAGGNVTQGYTGARVWSAAKRFVVSEQSEKKKICFCFFLISNFLLLARSASPHCWLLRGVAEEPNCVQRYGRKKVPRACTPVSDTMVLAAHQEPRNVCEIFEECGREKMAVVTWPPRACTDFPLRHLCCEFESDLGCLEITAARTSWTISTLVANSWVDSSFLRFSSFFEYLCSYFFKKKTDKGQFFVLILA